MHAKCYLHRWAAAVNAEDDDDVVTFTYSHSNCDWQSVVVVVVTLTGEKLAAEGGKQSKKK